MKGNKDEYSDSDEDQHDAYLERMKAEGKIREEGNDSDESDGESGESFLPWANHNIAFSFVWEGQSKLTYASF